jgi:hypothetical protein
MVCAEVGRLEQLDRGMVAFEKQRMRVELGGSDETVMEDAKDDGRDSMRYQS